MLNELGFRILNCITCAKTNPPPNLSCKFFTHSTEFILWARKNKKVTHPLTGIFEVHEDVPYYGIDLPIISS